MGGGRFDGNVEYWSPESMTKLAPSGANNKYIVRSQQIVRIIPAADMFIRFTNDSTDPIPTSANILLKADEEYFISSGENKFLLADLTTANVVIILQKGSVVRNAKPK